MPEIGWITLSYLNFSTPLKGDMVMGLFMNALEGLVDSLARTAVDHLGVMLGNGGSSKTTLGIERLCKEIGWKVGEREGNTIFLYFNDPIVRTRKVIICGGDTGKLTAISVLSGITLFGQEVKPETLGHLLERNGELLVGAWQALDLDDGKVTFALKYCALATGLDATTFKCICEYMVKEAHDFDAKMKAMGIT
jgi:hypothetical protein